MIYKHFLFFISVIFLVVTDYDCVDKKKSVETFQQTFNDSFIDILQMPYYKKKYRFITYLP